jgi:CheY-like chemotaxis protein
MESRPDIPVVLCTGYSDLIDKKTALALGIKEYVNKPLVMSALLQKVRTIFDKKELEG